MEYGVPFSFMVHGNPLPEMPKTLLSIRSRKAGIELSTLTATDPTRPFINS
jgi:hypothetical protein